MMKKRVYFLWRLAEIRWPRINIWRQYLKH